LARRLLRIFTSFDLMKWSMAIEGDDHA
jgi:hypothetical protein